MNHRQWLTLMVIITVANMALGHFMTDLEIIRYALVSFFVLVCWWLIES